MEGLFSNGDHQLDGRLESLYPLADFLCPVGDPLADLRRCSFVIQFISDQYDLGLLPAEGKKAWHLSSK